MEKISIVIPTYNVAGYLEQTLESLAAQTRPFELWLIDDHSTDQSAQLAEAFTRDHPDYHFHQFTQHQGISAARNYGIEHATGDAIAFVDGDDALDPLFVETLADSFTDGVVAAAVGYVWHGSRTTVNHPIKINQREMFNQVSSHGSEIGGYVWNKAFAKTAIDAINLRFDETLPIAEDYLFTSAFVANTAGSYAYNPKLLYTKINRPNSTIHTASFKNQQIEREVFKQINGLKHLVQ